MKSLMQLVSLARVKAQADMPFEVERTVLDMGDVTTVFGSEPIAGMLGG